MPPFTNLHRSAATAFDGTYIVSISYTQTPAPSGGGAGQIVGTFTCV
jgi:hypothetical protein